MTTAMNSTVSPPPPTSASRITSTSTSTPTTNPPGPSNPSTATSFAFPPTHAFPPFYTLQPNSTTRHAQLTTWSSLILSYARHHRLFKLSLSDALAWDLFNNQRIGRRLNLRDVREVVDFMVRSEGRAEWVAAGGPGMGKARSGGAAGLGDAGQGKEVCWIWWRKPEEWAEVLEGWVDETGQKNTVLTLYELTEGEATRGAEFHSLDPEILQRSLSVLVRRGKAQIFGGEGMEGVKFF